MKPEDLFERLVENAIDFLETALEEFEENPKFSVIHFAAAVELFLKARLLAEHWSLVVSGKQEPDWDNLLKGDFLSVTFDEAASRLKKVVRSGLTDDEKSCFKGVANHRNKMVHFFHSALSDADAKTAREQIAREQIQAWYYLRRLLLERWSVQFSKFSWKIQSTNDLMRRHKKYLEVAYENARSEINQRKKDGRSFRKCPICEYESLEQKGEVEDGIPAEGTCLVCGFDRPILTADCPECEEPVEFIGDGYGECQKCGKRIEPTDLAELLDESPPPYEDSEPLAPAHCTECESLYTVIERDGNYFCTNCFTSYNDEEIEQCDYCSDHYAGHMEDTYFGGCVACDGKSGYLATKDD